MTTHITKQTLTKFKLKGIHPVAQLFPLMSVEEFEAACLSVQETGFQNPIRVNSKQILLDGRNRLLIGEKVGIEPPVEIIDPENPAQWILNENLHRRHLTIKQRAFVGARIATLPKGANQHTPIGVSSEEEAASLTGSTIRSLQRAKYILQNGSAEEIAEIEADEKISLNAGATKIKKAKAAKKKTKKKTANPQEPQLEAEEGDSDPYLDDLLDASMKLENSLKKIFQDRFEKLEALMPYKEHYQFQMNELSLIKTLRKLGEECFGYAQKLTNTDTHTTKQIDAKEINEYQTVSEIGTNN